MTRTLDDRYRRLLRSYPKGYRRERSAEILGTLMDLARPGQQRPALREAAALVLGGLRTRVGVHRRRDTATVWADALRWATLVLLADMAALLFAEEARIARHLALTGHPSTPYDLGYLLTAWLVVSALLATAAGHTWAGLPFTVAATVAQHWAPDWGGYRHVFWQLPVATVLMIALLRWRAPGPPRVVHWLPGLPVALILMRNPLADVVPEWLWSVYGQQFRILATVLVGCLLWSMMDARPAIAVGAIMVPAAVSAVLEWSTSHTADALYQRALAQDMLLWGIAALLPLAAGAVRAARPRRL
jgi:hypothetical protein